MISVFILPILAVFGMNRIIDRAKEDHKYLLLKYPKSYIKPHRVLKKVLNINDNRLPIYIYFMYMSELVMGLLAPVNLFVGMFMRFSTLFYMIFIFEIAVVQFWCILSLLIGGSINALRSRKSEIEFRESKHKK